MPSDRKQINVRLDPESEKLLAELLPAVTKSIGLNVSQADLFRLGLIELKRKFLPNSDEPEAKPTRKGAGR